MSINFAFILIMMLMCTMPAWTAEEEAPAKKTTTQNVGGLLFDVDEGVKIEQGPGGSIYMKSNKEFMQEKFAELDSKILQLENRVAELEKGKGKTAAGSSDSAGGASKVLVS